MQVLFCFFSFFSKLSPFFFLLFKLIHLNEIFCFLFLFSSNYFPLLLSLICFIQQEKKNATGGSSSWRCRANQAAKASWFLLILFSLSLSFLFLSFSVSSLFFSFLIQTHSSQWNISLFFFFSFCFLVIIFC